MIEAESVSRILVQSAGRFTSPVRVAVFFFGTAPATSLNEAENEQPETQVKKVETDEVEETEVMRPHQPGFRDITFPGLKGAPKWLLQVMRRLHTNLGHPSTPTMVRHLSASGASEAAIQAARHLRCEVCLRVQPPRLPRPAKAFTPRRFNDRLNLDVLWLKDISGRAHGYLSQVDEATCYHVLNYMRDRTEEETMRLLVNGWFAFFGPPDEMLLDSDGSFRGFRFETLQAQCAVRIRYAPADAHYQMGKVERHGQSIRYIVQRLVSQFAPLGAEELNLIVTMAASAKNSLLRRSGSSPAQWVFGRNPKLPGSLLSSGGNVESCSLYNDSDRLRLVEQIRTKAMMLYHQFESDAALRAALLRKPRPARGPFSEGQRVAYYRFRNTLDGEGTAEGYRQGIIVALDGSTLWIRNNRGRLISASKEQVRAVGGEEEWWAPSQSDLDLLKKSDQDLSEKHSTLAFRAPPGPQASDDQAVVAELDFQLRAQSPAPRALLDQSGQPVLDAEGQPLPATPAPPMMPPSMLVPPTPRSTANLPGTPRGRARSRSKTPARQTLPPVPEQQALPPPEPQALPPEHQALPPEHQALPPEQQALPPEQQALPPEQQALPGPSRMSSVSQVSGGHGQDSSRQVSSESAAVKRSSLGTSELQRDLERLMEQVPSDATSRGTKRPADELPDPRVQGQPRREPGTEDVAEAAASLLLFCQDCGEQHRVQVDGVDSCSRCLSTRTVSSPMHVLSWFDEVMEREALEQRFENRASNSCHTSAFPRATSFVSEFDDKNDHGSSTAAPSSTALHRLDVLRRHGRGEAHQTNWDGSPHELQPMFETNAFLSAAHHFGDHRETTEPAAPGATTSSTTTAFAWPSSRTPLPPSEFMAKQLRESRDFRPSTLHQLLDSVNFPSGKRNCLGTKSQGFLSGLYSHGGFSGISKASKLHRHLTSYVLEYMRHHGMRGQATSIYISKNAAAKCHRDLHNLHGSLNWVTSVGSFEGGELWVECKSADPPPEAVYRTVGDVQLPGFVTSAKDQVYSFRPDCYHETQPFHGERYSVVVYTSRLLPEISTSIRRRLQRMGFLLSPQAAEVCQVGVEDLPPWLHEAFAEAYPARAWQPPGEGETLAMDTSGDDAHDGAQEPPSRAQRQALKKELPWQAMSEAEIPQFVQAVLDEWTEWRKWSSCRPIWVDLEKIDPSLILKSRICYRWKPKGNGSYKPKARIVIAGYRDPHLPLLSRDSPVLSRAGLHCVLQWSTSLKVPLFSGDCKSAFLQGAADDERPQAIYMRAPGDPIGRQAVPEWSEANLLYKLSAPVYGQANAPRRWYVHVARTLTGLGWTAHTLDPCLWLLREECDGVLKITGVLGVHVDDMIMSVLPGREAALEALRGSFEWGSAWETKEFTFVGRHIKQHDDWSLTVDQASYVAEVPITKISMPPDEKLSDHPELITEFRSGIGSLQWMAGTTRGDIAADTSLLQKPPGELTVADLLEVNSMLRYVRATSDAYYKLIPIDFEDMLLIAYGDSAWANAPGGKSQGGLVVVATSKQVLQLPQRASLLEWKSYRHQRVLRSTLAAEAASLDKAEDYGNFLATMLSEMVDGRYSATLREVPLIEVVPVTDARSLWDAIHRLSTSFAEKRVEISIATLRQQCRALRWVPTEQQLADVLTKRSRSLRDAFRNWMSDPWITLVESRSPTDIDPNGANAAWR